MSLHTHRTSRQQERFVKWLPAHWRSSPGLVGTYVLDRPVSSVLPNTSASWQHDGGRWRAHTKVVLCTCRAMFLSRPESTLAHQSLLSCLTFLFTIWRKRWNCSLEALRKDAIIESKTIHSTDHMGSQTSFNLIYEWQFRLVMAYLYLSLGRRYENIGFFFLCLVLYSFISSRVMSSVDSFSRQHSADSLLTTNVCALSVHCFASLCIVVGLSKRKEGTRLKGWNHRQTASQITFYHIVCRLLLRAMEKLKALVTP